MFNNNTINFCNQLNIKLPIIQAPMAGGIVTPHLIREVGISGGLGSLPLGYLSVDEARDAIRKTAALKPGRFAVNLFIPTPAIHSPMQSIAPMLAHINSFRLPLGLPVLTEINVPLEANLSELLELIVNEEVSIISFTFGMLDRQKVQSLHDKNVFIMGTATTVQEGLALEQVGCDAVIAQGYEAGGHRGGGFLLGYPEGLVGTMSLIPQMVDALTIPVIASGGIMDGRGIAASLALGASAVQMGTAFLTCDESSASPLHKKMILTHPAESTCITSSFTGKSVRSFKNEFITATEHQFGETKIPAYPMQHYLTKELRSCANKSGQIACSGLWSGQGNPLSRAISVSNLVDELYKETLAAIAHCS